MPFRREAASASDDATAALQHTTDNTISSSAEAMAPGQTLLGGGGDGSGNAIDLVGEQRQQQFLANAKLCRLVRKCPWMYDRHHANYAKKSVLDKSWAKIAADCQDSVASCKERWRNIRAAFARSINIYKTHGGPNRVKPYYLHKELDFLVRPMMEGRDKLRYDELKDDLRDGADPEEEEDDDDDSDDAETQETKQDDAEQEELPAGQEAQGEEHGEASCRQNVAETIVGKQTPPRSAHHKQFSLLEQTASGMGGALAAPVGYMDAAPPEEKRMRRNDGAGYAPDVDAKFLEALLPDMRAMNARQKIIFKRKVYQSMEEVMETNADFPKPIKMQTTHHSYSVSPPTTTTAIPSTQVTQAMLKRVVSIPDVELQRLFSRSSSAYRAADVGSGDSTSGPNTHTLTYIPTGTVAQPMDRSNREVTNSHNNTNNNSATTSTTTGQVEAPWVVPMRIKEELDDVDIE